MNSVALVAWLYCETFFRVCFFIAESAPRLVKVVLIYAYFSILFCVGIFKLFMVNKSGADTEPGGGLRTREDLERFIIKAGSRFDPGSKFWMDQANKLYSSMKSVYFSMCDIAFSDAELARVEKVKFWGDVFISAFDPDNYLHVISSYSCIDHFTAYKKYLCGFSNLLTDLHRCSAGSVLNLSYCNPDGFIVGENIATSEGQVVYQNQLIQLLYFSDLSGTIGSIPVLIVPPWLKKYYIFDLQESNSIIDWMRRNGYCVFVVSWNGCCPCNVNYSIEDYLFLGLIRAIDEVLSITGVSSVNLIGYCAGGVLAAVALGYMASIGNLHKVSSITFLAVAFGSDEMDYRDIFLDEESLDYLDDLASLKGYVSSSEFEMFFNLLKRKGSIWKDIVNSYIMGEDRPRIAMLFWNMDGCKINAALHREFLEVFYVKNLLMRKDGKLIIGGAEININEVNVPVYCVSAIDDNVTPYMSCYNGFNFMHKKNRASRFILSGGGHVSGMINHPNKSKYWYKVISSDKFESCVSQDIGNIKSICGSWWLDWDGWVKSESIYIPRLGSFKIPWSLVLENAPGSYAINK